MNGMVEGKKESKMPKHQVTLRQTLCEPLSVTNDDGEGAQKLGERQLQDGGFQVSFSMFPQVMVPRPLLPPSCGPGQGRGGVSEGRCRLERRN